MRTRGMAAALAPRLVAYDASRERLAWRFFNPCRSRMLPRPNSHTPFFAVGGEGFSLFYCLLVVLTAPGLATPFAALAVGGYLAARPSSTKSVMSRPFW